MPERGKHRRLDVPKAGDLYVNGTKVAKGNVYRATKRVISRQDRRQLLGLEQAEVILANTADLDVDGGCVGCGEYLPAAGTVAYEPATGRAWHMGTDCRSRTYPE